MRGWFLGLAIAVTLVGGACKRDADDDGTSNSGQDGGSAASGAMTGGGGSSGRRAGSGGRSGFDAPSTGGSGMSMDGGVMMQPPPTAGAGTTGGFAGFGGYWETCCREGVVTSCYCQSPPCSFGGWNGQLCSDGTCRPSGVLCPEAVTCSMDPYDYDQSVSIEFDPLPGWTRCCMRNETRLCWQPEGVDCGYEDGVTFDGATCTRPGDDAGI